MAPKPKQDVSKSCPKRERRPVFAFADGLGAYTYDPASFPQSRVIYYNEDFVLINDLYPKSSVHCLLLPRDPVKQLEHPLDVFNDLDFLEQVRAETSKAKKLVAGELRRRYGKVSAQDKSRREAMDADDPPDELPPGRNWENELIVGIHAAPSMNHLHIHILSKDMYSPCTKKDNHYNSFNTPFLVGLGRFPLSEDDPVRHHSLSGYLHQDMHCWRCSRPFGKKFARLKEHLEEEYEEWKRQ